MPLESQQSIVVVHAHAVIDHANQPLAARLHLDANRASARIQRCGPHLHRIGDRQTIAGIGDQRPVDGLIEHHMLPDLVADGDDVVADAELGQQGESLLREDHGGGVQRVRLHRSSGARPTWIGAAQW